MKSRSADKTVLKRDGGFERARVLSTPHGQMEEDVEKAGVKFDQETGWITVIDEE